MKQDKVLISTFIWRSFHFGSATTTNSYMQLHCLVLYMVRYKDFTQILDGIPKTL